MRLRIAMPLLLALAVPAFVPAWADDAADAEKLCDTGSDRERIVAACTTMIGEKVLRNSARATAYVNRGAARPAEDRTGKLADFDAAIALDPNNYRAFMVRGNLRVTMGELDGALADFNQAIRIEPRNAGPHLNRGNLYFRMKRYDEAIADARFTPVLGGGIAFVNLKCRAEAFGGADLDEAQKSCEQALWAESELPVIVEASGIVALKQKHFQAAWNDFNHLVTIQPNVARNWYGRGLAAAGLGRDAEGKADLARATALNANVAANFAETGIRP